MARRVRVPKRRAPKIPAAKFAVWNAVIGFAFVLLTCIALLVSICAKKDEKPSLNRYDAFVFIFPNIVNFLLVIIAWIFTCGNEYKEYFHFKGNCRWFIFGDGMLRTIRMCLILEIIIMFAAINSVGSEDLKTNANWVFGIHYFIRYIVVQNALMGLKRKNKRGYLIALYLVYNLVSMRVDEEAVPDQETGERVPKPQNDLAVRLASILK